MEKEKEKKQILLINDMPGYGKVATAAMLPILAYMGHPTYNLPTALVSNTLDYGKFKIMDTTDYIKGVFPIWSDLGFGFSAIATGLFFTHAQAELISSYCREQRKKGTAIFVDPIMGDEGKLYNGITPDIIGNMKQMVAVAQLIYPNYTEACLLTGNTYNPQGVTSNEARAMLDKLHALGAQSVLITSIPIDGIPSVAGFNHTTGEYFVLHYQEIPVHFPGTGDIFSAVLIGHLLNGRSLKDSTRMAMDTVWKLIDLNKNNTDKNRGIPLERYLYVISEAEN